MIFLVLTEFFVDVVMVVLGVLESDCKAMVLDHLDLARTHSRFTVEFQIAALGSSSRNY